MRNACLTHGFFQLTAHPIPPTLQAAVFAQARAFFALPLASKRAADKHGHLAGGYEAFERYALAPGTAPGLNEGFCVAAGHAPTRYPADAPAGFRATCEAYVAHMHALERRVIALVGAGLGLAPGYFDDYFVDDVCHARLIHYFRPPGAGADRVGAAAHSDWGFLTLLLQGDVPGLEVRAADGAWIPVPPTPGAYVVNCGDLLSRFTNGVYVSATHRVVAPPEGVHRYSVPFFSGGNPDYLVDVLPMGNEWKQWVGEKKDEAPRVEKRWEPITAGDYFKLKWIESGGD